MAAHGAGAAALERTVVVRGAGWSPGLLYARAAAAAAAASAAAGIGGGGSGASASAAAAAPSSRGDAARLIVPDVDRYGADAAASDMPPLPQDFARLRREAGLRSLAATAIGPPGGEPLGVLVLGRAAPGGFKDQWGAMVLAAAATSLLQHVRQAAVAQAAGLLVALDDERDPAAAIGALLRLGSRFMWRATNVAMGVRLALVEPGEAAALVFESTRPPECGAGGGGSGAAAAPRQKQQQQLPHSGGGSVTAALAAPDPALDVAVREVPLANTLLASAIAMRKARFVRDAASYLQNCPSPARDVFTHASSLVASVVVVPLLVGGAHAAAADGSGNGSGSGGALGALYFTQDAPCDFSNTQDALLGFVHCVTVSLRNKLAGQMALLKGLADQAARQKARSCDGAVAPALRRPSFGSSAARLLRPASGAAAARAGGSDGANDDSGSVASDASGSAEDAAGALADPAAPLSPQQQALAPPPPAASGRLSKVSSRRLCTEAMLKVLQQEIRKGKRRSVELSFVGDHLVISAFISHGGFGRVFRGTWHKRPAAIKVMNARHSDSEALGDAMEMAVLSSVQHPNIVSVYACLTDMVEVAPPAAASTPAGAGAGGSSGALMYLGGGSASPPPGAGLGAAAAVSPDGAPQSQPQRQQAVMPAYRRMQPGEDDADAPAFNIIVMVRLAPLPCCPCCHCRAAMLPARPLSCCRPRRACSANRRYRSMQCTLPFTNRRPHACIIINTRPPTKQEYADRGTLGDAVMRDGLFHRRLEGGAVGVDLPAVVDVSRAVMCCVSSRLACLRKRGDRRESRQVKSAVHWKELDTQLNRHAAHDRRVQAKQHTKHLHTMQKNRRSSTLPTPSSTSTASASSTATSSSTTCC